LLGMLGGTTAFVGLEGALVLNAPPLVCVVFVAGVEVCIVIGTEPGLPPQILAKAAPDVTPRGGEGIKAEGGMVEEKVMQSHALRAASISRCYCGPHGWDWNVRRLTISNIKSCTARPALERAFILRICSVRYSYHELLPQSALNDVKSKKGGVVDSRSTQFDTP
jgi:hypothetical protein